MAKSTSGAKGKGKKGKKGTAQRLLLGAGLLLLGWYLYTRSKKAKQQKALQDSMGAGIPIGDGMGGQPVHPDTGIPCSQVFGGCPDGGVFPPSGGGGGGGLPPSYPPTYPSGTTVYGCTNAQANNYNPIATTEDNSCTFDAGTTVYGCTNPSATNYDENATNDDLSCTFGGVYGCMNDQANNYDPLATIDDQSCTFDTVIDGCTDSNATNYNPTATNDDGTCSYTSGACNVPTAENYSGVDNNVDCAGVLNGTDTSCCCLNDVAIDCWTTCPNPQSQTFTTASCGITDSCGDSSDYPLSAEPMCAQPIDGCMNQSAYNYNPSATNDDGTCCLTAGCMDSQATNYDPDACHDDGSCATPQERFRCDAGSCLSCGYGASAQNCPHTENTCGNSCTVTVQTQNLSCWTGCNPQSTAVPVNGVGVSETCETVDWGEALYSSQQSCQLPQVTCYQCHNNAPVGNQFAQTSCPEGWQSTVPSCQAQQVTCYQCHNNAPVGNQFAQTSCPQGWQSTVPSCTTASRFSGFAGGEKSFGDWQRTMANKIMINDLDWNPQTSE